MFSLAGVGGMIPRTPLMRYVTVHTHLFGGFGCGPWGSQAVRETAPLLEVGLPYRCGVLPVNLPFWGVCRFDARPERRGTSPNLSNKKNKGCCRCCGFVFVYWSQRIADNMMWSGSPLDLITNAMGFQSWFTKYDLTNRVPCLQMLFVAIVLDLMSLRKMFCLQTNTMDTSIYLRIGKFCLMRISTFSGFVSVSILWCRVVLFGSILGRAHNEQGTQSLPTHCICHHDGVDWGPWHVSASFT